MTDAVSLLKEALEQLPGRGNLRRRITQYLGRQEEAGTPSAGVSRIYEHLKDAPEELADAFTAALTDALERSDAEGSWQWRPSAWEAFQRGWNARDTRSARESISDALLRDGEPNGFRTMPIQDRIKAALQRIRDGQASMRVPADQTDPDIVLADCLTLLSAAIATTEQTIEQCAKVCDVIANANSPEPDYMKWDDHTAAELARRIREMKNTPDRNLSKR